MPSANDRDGYGQDFTAVQPFQRIQLLKRSDADFPADQQQQQHGAAAEDAASNDWQQEAQQR